jgi:hypothetical protein
MPLRGVGKPKPGYELPGTLGRSDHLRFNVSQKQFGAPEQRERCVRLDGSPGQVNEPLPRSALDVWSPNVRSGRASDHRRVKRPHRRRRITGMQIEQLVAPIAMLDSD